MSHQFDYENCKNHRCSLCINNLVDSNNLPCNKCIKGILKVELLNCYFEANEYCRFKELKVLFQNNDVDSLLEAYEDLAQRYDVLIHENRELYNEFMNLKYEMMQKELK